MTSPLITQIKIGDIYISKRQDYSPRLIGGGGDIKPFQFLGLNGLKPFNPKGQFNWAEQEAINNLNENDFYLAGNVKDKTIKSLDLARSQMNGQWLKEKLAAKVEKIKPEPAIPKLDIPDGYKLLKDNDIVPINGKYRFFNTDAWGHSISTVGKTVGWGKKQFGDRIEYISPIED